MGGRFVTVYFFIPTERHSNSDRELLSILGYDSAKNIFGPVGVTWYGINRLSHHICVSISFLYVELRNALDDLSEDDAIDKDPLLPLAYAIRDGAVRVKAEVAFLETRNYMIESTFERYWMVLLRDADALAGEWFTFLYLEQSIVESWAPLSGLNNRDELPGGPGRAIFAGRGSHRWF